MPMFSKKEARETLVDIAEDGQTDHGCPNPESLRHFLKSYVWWDDVCQVLTLEEQTAAINEGFSKADDAREAARSAGW